MSDDSTKMTPYQILRFKFDFENNPLDDLIGKVVRESAYLENVLREAVGILGGLGNDVDILLMGQGWDWLHSMASGFQKEPAYATRRCNDDALPRIGDALKEASAVWRLRNEVVHATWDPCPSLGGGECRVASDRGGVVDDDEYHVQRSIRRHTSHRVEHRRLFELQDIFENFQAVRRDLTEGLKEFNPASFE